VGRRVTGGGASCGRAKALPKKPTSASMLHLQKKKWSPGIRTSEKMAHSSLIAAWPGVGGGSNRSLSLPARFEHVHCLKCLAPISFRLRLAQQPRDLKHEDPWREARADNVVITSAAARRIGQRASPIRRLLPPAYGA
jgi:hypothetical protein